ncbi:hypothetical protein IQ268_17810 [Oculatella sp. LEGE 06141]|uniref:hypothetical protein n=1 Tax=Oculatella sp. LEGE 06141 TaxID=1828648 RepID=UPI0018816117|nr:hypothetical protein [Oculatella sp. LEGE 06141]MBE9180420.1 hypothetical protein [Oculatella sp. LEGE 06141]
MSTTETAQLLAALTQQNELLSQMLEALRQPKLGLVEAPALMRIYANRSNHCLWYTIRDGEVVPITATALAGYIQELRFETVERRGQPVVKLQLYLRGDRPYCVESGYDSNFSKGVLAALATMSPQQLHHPVTLSPQPGSDETVLFCRVYDATGDLIRAAYDDQTNWRMMARRAIANVEALHGQPEANWGTAS